MVTTIQEVTPFIMSNAIVAFGVAGTDTDFAKAVSSAVMTPATSIVPFKGLKRDAIYTLAGAPTYTLDLEFAQDWTTEDSLSNFLFIHEGEVMPATINVDDGDAGTTVWALTVSIAPGAIGGPVDSVATSTVSLGIHGKPTRTFTPPAPPGE